MAAVIALRPNDERGQKILDELEKRTEMQPEQVIAGTRTYYLIAEDADTNPSAEDADTIPLYPSAEDPLDPSAEDADKNAFDPVLDKIDPDWRHHVTHWPPGS